MQRSSLSSVVSSSSCGDHSTTESTSRPRLSSSEDSDRPPFPLRRLGRSPREILKKKAELGGGSPEAAREGEGPACYTDHFLEWEIRLRLFYIHQINRLRADLAGGSREELAARYRELDWRLGQAREELAGARGHKRELENRVRIVKQDQDCLLSLIEVNDQSALQELSRLQEQLKGAEEQLARLASAAGAKTPASSFRRVFAPPQEAAPALPDMSRPPPGLHLSDLLSLGGRLAELCRDEHGSRMVAERVRCGAPAERSLVRAELGLPGALGRCLASGPCRRVLRALVEAEPAARAELEEEARAQGLGSLGE